MASTPRPAKYHAGNLIPMFRLAAKLRAEMNTAGFTDNGGAIHSAERILNILGLSLRYPGLSHINNLKKHPKAEFSVDALAAFQRGERVLIEHFAPLRALTRAAIEEIERHVSDAELKKFVCNNYRLVLLTEDETKRLNKKNRSKLDPERLSKVNIQTTPRT